MSRCLPASSVEQLEGWQCSISGEEEYDLLLELEGDALDSEIWLLRLGVGVVGL